MHIFSDSWATIKAPGVFVFESKLAMELSARRQILA